MVDPAKDAARRATHGVSLIPGAAPLQDAIGDIVDERREDGEARVNAFGVVAGRLCARKDKMPGEVCRVIPVRRGGKPERRTSVALLWYESAMKREDALARLRRHEADLRRMGVKRLYLFGSTARGEARANSDVDLFYDYEKGTLGLLEVIGIEEAASAFLGCKADAMPRGGINRHVRPGAETEAVRVF